MKHQICMIMIALTYAFYQTDAVCQTESSLVQPDTILAGEYRTKGKMLLYAAEYDSAMQCFNNAMIIYEEALSRTEDQRLWEDYIHCLSYTGKNLVRQMKFKPAYETLHKALDLGREKLGENHIRVAFVYRELAGLYYRQSDLEKTFEYDKKYLDIVIQNVGPVHKDVADGYYNLSLSCRDMGDFDGALMYSEKARDVNLHFDEPDHQSLAGAYYGMGYAYIFKGYYDQAYVYLNKALKMRLEEYGEAHPLVAETYDALGFYYRTIWDLDQAAEYYKKSVSVFTECFGDQHPAVAYGNNNIGSTCKAKGMNDEALQYFRKALETKIQIFGKNHPSVANTVANIGAIYSDEGNYQKALEYYSRSLRIRTERLGEVHPSVAVDHASIGRIYASMHKNRKAIECYKKALTIQLQVTGENHPCVAEFNNLIGKIHQQQKDYAKAITHFQKSLVILSPEFSETDLYQNPSVENSLSDKDLLDALHFKAESFQQLYSNESGDLKDLKMALQTFQLAVDLIDDIRSGYKAEGSRLFLGEKVSDIYDQAIQTAVALYNATKNPAYKEKAFQLTEKSKFGTLALVLQDSKAKQFAGIPNQSLEQEKAIKADLAYYDTQLQKELLKKEAGSSQKINNFENKRFALHNQYQELINTFENKYPRYYDLKYRTQTIPVENLQTLLDDQTVLIEYFTGANTLTIFTFTQNQMEAYQTKTNSLFDQMAGSLIRSIKKIDFRNFNRTSVQLHKKLIAPVQNLLKGKKKIIIIPHGILAKIPFEVLMAELPDPSDQTDFIKINYLICLYEISYHYSATLYANQLKDKQERSASNGFAGFAPVFSDEADNNSVLADHRSAITDLDYSESDYRAVRVDGKRFNELKYSEKEIQGIVNCFETKKKTATGYYRKEASENNFKTTAGNYRYIHIASHGIVNEEYPRLSGIIFSQPGDSTNQEDGILYSGEIYNLNLNADLVVLSSCESGIGKLVRGEGLMALTRGFLYAGADNLIVSLWKVSDKHTSELMTELYKNILKGDNFSNSLREAKLTLLKNPETAFPKSWASFVLIGE
ncbi:CHAT domain-containing protein [bacterium]|nr:CHAT domain-containing protein [bacterium]